MMNEYTLVPLTVYVPLSCIDDVKKIVKSLSYGIQENDEEIWEEAKPLPDYIRPGKLLRAARLRADITQKELASMIGVPQSHISQYEKNIRKIPSDKAVELARILETSEDYFK